MKKILWLLVLALAVPALAVIPQFWEVRTYSQFLRGELDGLSVTAEGQLVLAPRFDLLFDTEDPLIFSAAADSVGNVYLGTGHDGKVYKVEPDGNAGIFVDLEELDVFALAVGSDDALFAGTSPGGKVYRISDAGNAEVFFDPGERYIWSLAVDPSGRLLVATGDEGVIYRVDSAGQSEVFYDSEETHIITMAIDGSGNVIAGGDPKGYVYRISDDGQPFVLYDSGMREVRSVAVAGDGTIYAAVLSAGGGVPAEGPGGGSDGPVSANPISITVEGARQGRAAQSAQVTAGPAAASGRADGGARSGGGASSSSRSIILEIMPNGAVTRIWDSDDEMVLAVLPWEQGLLFSTGTDGRIYSMESPRRATLVLESTEEQTTRLLGHGDRLFATSANGGKLYEIGKGAGTSGSYESTVRDTGAISGWGRVAWSGQGAEILTRSGNTSSPDQTWSEWASLSDGGGVASPSARFIQWKAALTSDAGETPVLSSVRIPYLQQNFRPEISQVNVMRSGVALETVSGGNNNGSVPNGINGGQVSGRVLPNRQRGPTRAVARPGAQALNWNAADENDDTLVYSVMYRAENESGWKLLGDGLTDSFYTVEPDTLPDGMYVFRIIASDIGSNPPELALAGEIDTVPFAIDHTPPVVAVTQGAVENGRVRVRVAADDETSTLKQAEVSVDAGRWMSVFPVDGIVDSQSERFEFSSEVLEAGEHVVAFRIYDQNENVGIGKTIVQIP